LPFGLVSRLNSGKDLVQMAAVSKSGAPSISTMVPCPAHQLSGLIAGEAIAAGDACYIKGSDGKVYLATGAAANAAAVVSGFAAKNYAVGQGVTLYHDVNLAYGSGLTPGARYFLSGTVPGGLDTAASTGGTTWIAEAQDATRVFVRKTA
jgi:hypothetical protein